MNILLVYPAFPDTFWSFKHALKFVGKKAVAPPLGLLTVAAIYQLGIRGTERVHYWKLFFWTLFRRPRLFPLAIYGYHFRKVVDLHLS